MNPPTDRIIDRQGRYFHIVLNMADDELDPYQYRLLGHYIRVGTCWESVRTTARICKMSIGKVVSARQELVDLGYIETASAPNQTYTVTIVDRMAENIIRYQRPPDDFHEGVHQVNRGVHVVNGGVHQVNQRITIEEEPLKNNDPSSVEEVPSDHKTTKPARSKAKDPNPPGSDAPPRPIQPHVELIDRWLLAQPGSEPVFTGPKYGGQFGRVATALIKAGITPAQVEDYTRALKADPWWSTKTVTLEFVAKNIRAWLSKGATTNDYGRSTRGPQREAGLENNAGGGNSSPIGGSNGPQPRPPSPGLAKALYPGRDNAPIPSLSSADHL